MTRKEEPTLAVINYIDKVKTTEGKPLLRQKVQEQQQKQEHGSIVGISELCSKKNIQIQKCFNCSNVIIGIKR